MPNSVHCWASRHSLGFEDEDLLQTVYTHESPHKRSLLVQSCQTVGHPVFLLQVLHGAAGDSRGQGAPSQRLRAQLRVKRESHATVVVEKELVNPL